MSKKIIITTKGNISPKDKAKMSKAGCVVIEAETPSDVKILDVSITHDIMMSALKESSKGLCANEFTKELYSRLKGKEPINPTS